MKLASFKSAGQDRIGFAFDGDTVIDLSAAAAAAKLGPAPANMISLIEAGEAGRALVDAAHRYVRDNPGKVAPISQADIEWHPPARRPGKIIGNAMNNSGSNARKISAPDHPLFFLKPASCLIGHKQPIEVHPSFGSVHPEPELAVIIGKRCKHVSVESAMSVVYGYSIIDDVTGNNMRAEDMVHYYALYRPEGGGELERREQHLSYPGRYKGTDTFGPMGPWLVTADEVADPHVLDVHCWHNKDIIAEDSTRYYTYGVPEIIAFITRFHSLWPGDVISMGTAFRPGKTGSMSLHAANITALGGSVTITISSLGTLYSPVKILSDAEIAPA